MPMKDTKTKGALTVLEFAYECVKRGATVSEPIGDNSRYDLIVDSGTRLSRVQVKKANDQGGGVFSVNGTRKVSGKSVPYVLGELDCLVTRAGNSWFFFPEPHKLKSIFQVRPGAAVAAYTWNFGKDNWASLGFSPQLEI